MSNMIFLMCSERSGSNLITKIFDAHPDIAGPSTSHVGDVVIPSMYSYGTLKGVQWFQLIEDIIYLLNTKNAVWKKIFTNKELISSVKEGDISALFDYIYMAEAHANNKKTIFIKENRIYEFSQFLTGVFPAANYIYMVRDPRDMAASWKHSYAIRGGVVRAAKVWKTDQIGFFRMRSWLCKFKAVPTFRYEDLLRKPEYILEQVCDLLSLEYNKEMLNYYSKDETVDNSKAAADWQNIASPLMSDNIGKYKNKLSVEEVMYIESHCHNEMSALGYTPEYEILGNNAFNALEERLLTLEPNEKESYRTIDKSEKNRRRRHHKYSNSIRNRKFIMHDII